MALSEMKLSVVIPLYNKANTIQRALNSIFCQNFPPEEIIVVNDGSTDGSDTIVRGLNHPLVRLVSQSNQGVSAARNRGIAEAKSEWVAFLDADDEWLPEFLETILKLSNKFPQSKVLATSYFIQDQTGRKRRSYMKNLPFTGDEGLLTNYFMVAACSEPPIHSSSVVIERSYLEFVGGFTAGITSGEDLLLWARLAVSNEIGYCAKPLSIFVQDKAHTYDDKPSRLPQIPDLVGIELARLANQNREISGLKDYVAHWHKMRASIFLRLGMKKEALHDSIRSLTFRRENWRVLIYFILLPFPNIMINKIFKRFGNA